MSDSGSVLQLWSFGPQRMWEDHAAEMHRGNSEDLAGPHFSAGEAARIPRSRRAREEGWIHATGNKQHFEKVECVCV